MTKDAPLDQIRLTGEQLRTVFADERRAISTLDHAALEQAAARKQELATRLDALRKQLEAEGKGKDPSVRELFVAIRIEAQATALLASAANQAVRSMLGYKPANVYDRRAQHQTSHAGRVLATY